MRYDENSSERQLLPQEAGKMRFEEALSEQRLLPQMPDHITEDHILGKLPWRTLDLLSTVSRSWNQAFQSRLDARLRSLATETNVTHLFDTWLYSPVDRFCCCLPPIPNVGIRVSGTGYTDGSGCALLNGKVYCVGGTQYDGDDNFVQKRDDVYVMDVGGERNWQQCKSMRFARSWKYDSVWKVVVLSGKIYVTSDEDGFGTVNFCEVYEPKTDTWDLIKIVPGQSVWDVMPGIHEVLNTIYHNLLGFEGKTNKTRVCYRETSTGSSILATHSTEVDGSRV